MRYQEVDTAISRMLGFEKYRTIMSMVNEVDVSEDKDGFQRLFNDYYAVRRDDTWLNGFYKYFQSIKTSDVGFDVIIDYIYNHVSTKRDKTHLVEASFSSKMLATINPNMPILDSKVLKNMNLSIKGNKPCEKLESAKDAYKSICARYKEYIGSPTSGCDEMVAVFDSCFPTCRDFSKCKKVDWFLWALERDELIQIGKFGALL